MPGFETFSSDEIEADLLKVAEDLSEPWEAKHPDYKKCPKCKGTGTSVTKAKRNYSRCSQCSGTGWKYSPKPKSAGEVIHWTDWYQQNRKPASDEQKRRMKGLLQRGYTHAEAADLVSCVYDDMGRLFQKPPKVIEGAEKKADTEEPEVRDYTFFGLAVTQAEFAALMRSVVQDHKCPFCGKPAFIRTGLINHAKHCKAIPKSIQPTK